jgi:RHS repeat-associated protein
MLPRSRSETYDVENRLVLEINGTNYYDPAGKRVAQIGVISGQPNQLVYFYGITGQRLGTYALSSDLTTFSTVSLNLYFGGRLIRSGGVTVATDRLGSVRGNANQEQMSYWPYGQERTSTADWREKFATYFRDSQASVGLDYADQRYYSYGYGRFQTPDPYYGSVDLMDPQSWNRYNYGLDDPVNHADPTGLCTIDGVIYPDGQPPCPDVTGVTVNGGGSDPVIPVASIQRASPLGALQQSIAFAHLLALAVQHTPAYSPCDALADFANGLADSNLTPIQFAQAFTTPLVPRQFATLAGGLLYYSGSPQTVFLWSSGPSGYAASYQNTTPDSTAGNGDQGHHFAAFFEFGFLHPNAVEIILPRELARCRRSGQRVPDSS